ncbi:MAG: TIGR00341 family protein [Candidatus Eisenbacteria bacterium]|nr:TIGR00341 family protein [Candidatus Latescibacterota bacterium]MBD3303122.1 TIGR00341 family protein [Candidatus Eisenbacteria bacterium]
MPLRLLEVTVPVEDLAKIPPLIQEATLLHMRVSESGAGTGVMSILLEAQDVEAVSDLLVSHFGTSNDFRVILLPVEATLPAPIQPASTDAPEGAETAGGRSEARRISREELYEDIAQASRLTATYVVMVALSTVVAAVGLIRGDVAIVIGAMVIAPLLGPNVAVSLAMTLGDLDLAKRSLRTLGAGVVTALTLSLLAGLVLPIDPSAPEVVARTRPDIADVVLALAAGTAGALAFTSGVPAIVVGVMVAVALLPPLLVCGLLLGAGHWAPATGAFVLLLTNVACINLAGVATFFAQKVSPRTWWEVDRARKSTRLAVTVWILMLGLLFVLILLGHVGGV